MKIKHLIFDWDGTLANTYPVIEKAYEHTFKTLGLKPIPFDEIKRLTSSIQNKDLFRHIFGDKEDQAKQLYYAYIDKHHASDVGLMPDAADLLTFCKTIGLKLYLFSNKRRPYLIPETDSQDVTKFFTKIVAAGDFTEDKPHPMAAHAVFDNNLPEADSILVIGDGMADYSAARTYDHNGKTAPCIIYDPKGTYTGGKPTLKISNLKDIIPFLKENK